MGIVFQVRDAAVSVCFTCTQAYKIHAFTRLFTSLSWVFNSFTSAQAVFICFIINSCQLCQLCYQFHYS